LNSRKPPSGDELGAESRISRDRLVGMRVQISIDEDGTSKPPVLPPGKIVRRLIGGDRDDYNLIRLGSPVKCIRATTGHEWILLDW
jgi:hypothetical protein